ncbi:MAG: hypothetical protein JO149_03525 [Gammaproteobacteria bacterium]|nr:hypothetical protein [Gammaproteobacteria bacterium]
MSKDLSNALLGGVFLIAIAVFGYFIHRLDSQADQITKLETSVTVIMSALHIQMPRTNFDALVSASASKNIPPEKVATVIPMIEKTPAQAKVYMKQELYFNQREIDAVMKSPVYDKQGTPSSILHSSHSLDEKK